MDDRSEFKDPRTSGSAGDSALHGWLQLALGLGLIWMMGFVLLPWGRGLPLIRPIIEIIEQADIDAGAYWYTQSEETARAQMYVRNAIMKHH